MTPGSKGGNLLETEDCRLSMRYPVADGHSRHIRTDDWRPGDWEYR